MRATRVKCRDRLIGWHLVLVHVIHNGLQFVMFGFGFGFFFFFFGGVQNKSVGARAVHDCCPLRPKHRQSHYSGITKHRNPPSFDLCVWILPPLKSVETTPLSELLVNFYQFHHWAEKRISSRHDVHFANTLYSRAGTLNTF